MEDIIKRKLKVQEQSIWKRTTEVEGLFNKKKDIQIIFIKTMDEEFVIHGSSSNTLWL